MHSVVLAIHEKLSEPLAGRCILLALGAPFAPFARSGSAILPGKAGVALALATLASKVVALATAGVPGAPRVLLPVLHSLHEAHRPTSRNAG